MKFDVSIRFEKNDEPLIYGKELSQFELMIVIETIKKTHILSGKYPDLEIIVK